MHEVKSIKGDEGARRAARMIGKTKVKGEDGKEVEKEVWESLSSSRRSLLTTSPAPTSTIHRPSTARKTAVPKSIFPSTRRADEKFGRLTGEHVPQGNFRYRLVIVMDDELPTAPTLQSQITDNGPSPGIHQAKSQGDRRYHQRRQLPAALEPTPVRDMTTEATLGAETIGRARMAMTSRRSRCRCSCSSTTVSRAWWPCWSWP